MKKHIIAAGHESAHKYAAPLYILHTEILFLIVQLRKQYCIASLSRGSLFQASLHGALPLQICNTHIAFYTACKRVLPYQHENVRMAEVVSILGQAFFLKV